MPTGAQGFLEAPAFGHLGSGPHRPHRAAFPQFEGGCPRLERGQIAFVPEGELDGSDLVRLAMGQVGDRAVLDLSLFAIGFAQEDALIGLAVLGGAGGFGDVHDYYYT